MGQRLHHRGPDGAGCLLDGPVGLAHRRLSIIDVDGGAQPMSNEDGTVSVVFNGEIYNYTELRQRLIACGHRFSTHSDTETLVHLYEDVGVRLPEFLNGMFALAIWDSRRQELFLCRDRMGEKPLYYTDNLPGLRLAFASELKAFTALPSWEGEIEERSIADFLSFGYVPDPQTIFKGVYKLPPAHSLTLNGEGLRLRRYWRPRFDPPGNNRKATIAQLQELATDSVQRRMMSDVPLGAFLSGGVDSSAVTGLMASSASQQVTTFSIGFTDENFDERKYARMVAAQHRTEHYERVVTPAVHEILDLLSWHFDEPFGDSSAIPMLYLSRMTRERVTVALTGDGADELFGGYRRYRYGLLEQRLRGALPAWFRDSAVAAAGRWYPKADYLPQMFRAKTLLGNLACDIGDAYFTSMSTFGDPALDAVLAPELRLQLGGYTPRQAFRDRFRSLRHLDPLQQMQAVDLETYLPGDILVKTDRTTMAFSLESRAPWLDHRLADVALGLPPHWKVRGGAGKYVFKQAVAHLMPPVVAMRRKMGFSVPLAAWMRTSLKSTFETLALAPSMERFVSISELRRIWREHQSRIHNHDRKLWNVLMLAVWHERHGRNCWESPLVTVGEQA